MPDLRRGVECGTETTRPVDRDGMLAILAHFGVRSADLLGGGEATVYAVDAGQVLWLLRPAGTVGFGQWSEVAQRRLAVYWSDAIDDLNLLRWFRRMLVGGR